MKLKELEKLAADICTDENSKRMEIADRIRAANAKLQDLKAQAAELANSRDFDGYADNMENQRKQESIIKLAEQLSKRTEEQAKHDQQAAHDFAKKAQQAFDEDTAADWKELERQAIKTAEIAQRIRNKYNTAQQCKTNVFNAYQANNFGFDVTAPLSLCGTAESLPKQFENMREMEKRGIHIS